jgi:hypothetical protein
MLAPQDLMSKDIEELRQLVLDRKEEKKEKASKPSKKERRQKQEQQERAAERAERQQQEKAERREQEKAAKEQQQQQQQQQDSDRAEPMEEDGNGPLDITNVRAPPCCGALLPAASCCLPACLAPAGWPLLAGRCCRRAGGQLATAMPRCGRAPRRLQGAAGSRALLRVCRLPTAALPPLPPGDHLCGPRIRGVHLRLEPHRAAARLGVSRRAALLPAAPAAASRCWQAPAPGAGSRRRPAACPAARPEPGSRRRRAALATPPRASGTWRWARARCRRWGPASLLRLRPRLPLQAACPGPCSGRA